MRPDIEPGWADSSAEEIEVRVGDLNDEDTTRTENAKDLVESLQGVRDVLEHAHHRNDIERAIGKARVEQGPLVHGKSKAVPGIPHRIQGEVDAAGLKSTLFRHGQQEPERASDV